jgi:hypothetical protein
MEVTGGAIHEKAEVVRGRMMKSIGKAGGQERE